MKTSMIKKTQKLTGKLSMQVTWVKNYNFDLCIYLSEMQFLI